MASSFDDVIKSAEARLQEINAKADSRQGTVDALEARKTQLQGEIQEWEVKLNEAKLAMQAPQQEILAAEKDSQAKRDAAWQQAKEDLDAATEAKDALADLEANLASRESGVAAQTKANDDKAQELADR